MEISSCSSDLTDPYEDFEKVKFWNQYRRLTDPTNKGKIKCIHCLLNFPEETKAYLLRLHLLQHKMMDEDHQIPRMLLKYYRAILNEYKAVCRYCPTLCDYVADLCVLYDHLDEEHTDLFTTSHFEEIKLWEQYETVSDGMICLYCKKKYSESVSNSELRKHLLDTHSKIDKDHKVPDILLRHFSTKENEYNAVCKHCFDTCSYLDDFSILREHVKLHSKQFKMNNEFENVNLWDEYDKTTDDTNNENIVKCKHCPKKFSLEAVAVRPAALRNHLLIHGKIDEDHVVPIWLKKHYVLIKNEYKVECKYCGKICAYSKKIRSLEKHLYENHSNKLKTYQQVTLRNQYKKLKNQAILKCKHCPAEFSDIARNCVLRSHLFYEHSKMDKDHQLPLPLLKHFDIKKNGYKTTCKYCFKTFNYLERITHLKKHLRDEHLDAL